jgi:outer membrane scaffolding protein for murein synthesis (MipA/OmpV family)
MPLTMAVMAPRMAVAGGNLLLMEAPPASTTLAVGAGLWAWPRYPGSARDRLQVLPAVDLALANGFFASTDTGVGWNLSRQASWQYGLRLWPQWGRRGRDATPVAPAIGDRLQTEAFCNWAALPTLLLQSGLLTGAGAHRDGQQLELGATSGAPIGPDLVAIGLSATFANRAYRRAYSDAGLGAGWQDATLTLGSEHRLSPTWRISGQWLLTRLSSSGAQAATGAGASPWQATATVSAWREF